MSVLSQEDIREAHEFDVAMKVHVDQCFDYSQAPSTQSVITDAHDTYVKLLAYAGPPPHDNVTRGVTKVGQYTTWVRYVATGVRTLFPMRDQKGVYNTVLAFADWCRQQRRK